MREARQTKPAQRPWYLPHGFRWIHGAIVLGVAGILNAFPFPAGMSGTATAFGFPFSACIWIPPNCQLLMVRSPYILPLGCAHVVLPLLVLNLAVVLLMAYLFMTMLRVFARRYPIGLFAWLLQPRVSLGTLLLLVFSVAVVLYFYVDLLQETQNAYGMLSLTRWDVFVLVASPVPVFGLSAYFVEQLRADAGQNVHPSDPERTA